jgi:hypothetical protein
MALKATTLKLKKGPKEQAFPYPNAPNTNASLKYMKKIHPHFLKLISYSIHPSLWEQCFINYHLNLTICACGRFHQKNYLPFYGGGYIAKAKHTSYIVFTWHDEPQLVEVENDVHRALVLNHLNQSDNQELNLFFEGRFEFLFFHEEFFGIL